MTDTQTINSTARLYGTAFTAGGSSPLASIAELSTQLEQPGVFAFVEIAGRADDQLADVSAAIGDPELLSHVPPASGRAVLTQVNDDVTLSARLANFSRRR